MILVKDGLDKAIQGFQHTEVPAQKTDLGDLLLMVKFALGENVVQTYFARSRTRYPLSRMGVP